jgi:hypothetical protein
MRFELHRITLAALCDLNDLPGHEVAQRIVPASPVQGLDEPPRSRGYGVDHFRREGGIQQ